MPSHFTERNLMIPARAYAGEGYTLCGALEARCDSITKIIAWVTCRKCKKLLEEMREEQQARSQSSAQVNSGERHKPQR